jgi:hypothetical protein
MDLLRAKGDSVLEGIESVVETAVHHGNSVVWQSKHTNKELWFGLNKVIGDATICQRRQERG